MLSLVGVSELRRAIPRNDDEARARCYCCATRRQSPDPRPMDVLMDEWLLAVAMQHHQDMRCAMSGPGGVVEGGDLEGDVLRIPRATRWLEAAAGIFNLTESNPKAAAGASVSRRFLSSWARPGATS